MRLLCSHSKHPRRRRRSSSSSSTRATTKSTKSSPSLSACIQTLLLVLFQSVLIIMPLFSFGGAGGKNKASAASMVSVPSSREEIENRLRGALWGFFAGDALSSPTHWYYGGRRQIISDYGAEISDYTKPSFELYGSILNKSNLNGGGRATSSLSNLRGQKKNIIGDVILHGKAELWSPKKNIHYHATLQKGENTLEVQIARILMKSIVQTDGTFDPDHFRQAYMDFMMTPGSHNDTYCNTCHRMFFVNLVHNELPPKDCPDNDGHNVDTIDGLVLPTIVALSEAAKGKQEQNTDTSHSLATACAAVTRRSSVLEKVMPHWSALIHASIQESNDEFFYQNDFESSFSKSALGNRFVPNPRTDPDSTMSACYLSQSLPGMLHLTSRYLVMGQNSETSKDEKTNFVWQGLLANANVGGENVHRGSIMGAILGARGGLSSLPDKLTDGLYPHDELSKEIDEFVNAVLPSTISASEL